MTSDSSQDLESNAVALVGAVLDGDSSKEDSVDSVCDANELTPQIDLFSQFVFFFF